jgi:hypothetical protein
MGGFAPGERRFAVKIPFLTPRAVELLGRQAFGVSTVLLLGILALFAVLGARSFTSRGGS